MYVDNDPMVLVHARALLTSTPEGATDYIDVMLGILGNVLDTDEARSIVNRLVDAVPSGSCL